MSKKQAQNEILTNLQKPKAVSIQRSDRAKTAPIDHDFDLEVIDNEGENSEYIKTYNYYIYYHSLKPRDPRLPKPLYKPKPDLEFIKKGLKLDGEIAEQDEEKSIITNSFGKISSNNMPKIVEHDEFGEEYNLDIMMKNLNIGDKTMMGSSVTGGNNAFSSYFDYIQNPNLNNSQFNMSNYNNYSQFQNNDFYDAQKPNKQVGNDLSGYYQKNIGLNMAKNPETFDYNFYSGSDGFSQFNTPIFPSYGTSGKQAGMMNNLGMGNNNFNYANNNMNMNNNYMNLNSNMMPQSQPYQTKSNYYQKNNNFNYNNNTNDNSYYQYNQFMNPPPQNMNNQGGFMNNMNNVGGMNSMGSMNPNSNFGMVGGFNNNNNNNNNNLPFNNKKNNKNMMQMNKMHMNNLNQMSMQNINHAGAVNPMNSMNSSYSNFPSNNQSSKKGYPFEIPSFNDILANVISYSKDHSGSRLVQKKYEDSNEEDRQQMFNILFPETYNLTKDVFGNYVIQKMLEYSSPEQRKLIIDELEGKIYELTVHMYGCRVIQKAIEVAEVQDVRKHLGELKNYIKFCIEDQNGNHVIQKLIEKLPVGEHKEIIRVIQGKTFELSTHQYGCRVIQRVFEYCSNEEKETILKEIYERIIDLCLDQFGNYVIQHIIEKMGPSKIAKIFIDLKGKIFDLSIHKFASNVIEKCLNYGYPTQKTEIIGEIMMIDDQTNESLLALVKDKYGNYVVQKMIEVADHKTKEIIIKRIISSQALKKRDGFSKHVINFIEKMGFNANSLK